MPNKRTDNHIRFVHGGKKFKLHDGKAPRAQIAQQRAIMANVRKQDPFLSGASKSRGGTRPKRAHHDVAGIRKGSRRPISLGIMKKVPKVHTHRPHVLRPAPAVHNAGSVAKKGMNIKTRTSINFYFLSVKKRNNTHY